MRKEKIIEDLRIRTLQNPIRKEKPSSPIFHNSQRRLFFIRLFYIFILSYFLFCRIFYFVVFFIMEISDLIKGFSKKQ